MKEMGIPTARFNVFDTLKPAIAFLDELKAPYVIKADGLAAGKGVIIAETRIEAEAALRDMLEDARFGEAGRQVVIEEFISGEEASFIALCDGDHALALASSQDHKRLLNGDRGPNTGGMGAYSPAPVLTADLENRIMDTVITPVLKGMQARGTPYRGFLYAGIMIDASNNLNVLEFNCRLGDPETQPLLFRLESDLVPLIEAAIDGKLAGQTLCWTPGYSVCVVMAAKGYPGAYKKGGILAGLPAETPTCKVFHAGTTKDGDSLRTSGGRVLGVTAKGATLRQALDVAYAAVATIDSDDLIWRTDIGHRALKGERV